jgi:uncharacterized protein
MTPSGPNPAGRSRSPERPESAPPIPLTASASDRIGPGFECVKAVQPLARLICASTGLAEADLRYVEAYMALRELLPVEDRPELRQEANQFIEMAEPIWCPCGSTTRSLSTS